MLVELVPEAEFLALEQAMLVAEKQRVPVPSKTVLSQKTMSACFAPKAKSAGTPNNKSATGTSDSKKRKLPSSFAQQEAQAAPVKRAALCYTGPVTYAYTPFEVDHHCTQLLRTNPTAVGFDIEWRVTYKIGEVRKTALMQLCSKQENRLYNCLLLHVAHSGLTPAVRQLLQNEDVKKVGVGISADAQKLLRDFDVECSGIVCLAEKASMRMARTGGRGLADLVQQVLGHDLHKSTSIRCSNWEKCPLTPEQKAYAATDAYASIKLYQVLQSMPLLPAQPRPAPASPAPWTAGDEPQQAPLVVPAQAVLLPLQPAKLAAYKLFVEEGLSMEAIAAQRTLQVSTVQSYLAEAMAAGYSYPWHRMGLPHRLLASLCDHVRAYSKQLQVQQQTENEQLQQQSEQLQPQQQTMQQLQRQQRQADHVQVQQQGQQMQVQQPAEKVHSQHQDKQQLQQVHCGQLQQQCELVLGQALQAQLQQSAQQRQLQPLCQTAIQSGVSAAQPAQSHQQSGLSVCAVSAVCKRCSLPLDSSSLHLHDGGTIHCALVDQICCGNGMNADGTAPRYSCTAEQNGAKPTDKSCSSAVQLPDWSVVEELVLTSKGTRALKDSMDGCQLSYGHIRLGLAHIYCLLRHALCTCKPTTG